MAAAFAMNVWRRDPPKSKRMLHFQHPPGTYVRKERTWLVSRLHDRLQEIMRFPDLHDDKVDFRDQVKVW